MAGKVDQRIANMEECIAFPRKNGELVFEAPWEARAFGLAVALSEQGLYSWQDFSQGLAEEIVAAEQNGIESSYYERWLASLEKLIVAKGLTSPEELDARSVQQALEDQHEHDHDHQHNHDHHHHGPHDS